MSQYRREFLGGVGAATIAGLAGCLGDGGGGDAAANIGMVYATGGLGDGSFNDQAQNGVIRAEEELDIAYDESQPEEVSDFPNAQQRYAQSDDPDYDLVCCIGFLQADALTENADEFSDQNFMIVDAVVESDNVGSYVFREHEGSFLVGVLAGRLTTMDLDAGGGSTSSGSGKVGFVGGVDSPLINRFEAGFLAGVQHADESVEVQTAYTGSFNEPSAGQEAAISMYDSGADIVYHASGNTGDGVFRAAQDAERYAIGVDQDQSVTESDYSDVILASMVKRVDNAVFTAIEEVVNDEFSGGETVALGLEQNGVEAVYGQDLGGDIPDDVKSDIDEARQGIIDGDIQVPEDPDQV